jgi:hypothetical protein
MILDPSWSLNRVCIVDLPGLTVPDHVMGHVAYELVSAHVLANLVRQHAHVLQIDSDLDDHALRLAFDASLDSSIPSIRTAANDIACTVGQNLGYVLLALQRGDEVNRKARPEWGSAHWEHWAGIRRVWLGGGLVSGNLGPRVAHYASQVVWEGGLDDYVIRVSPYGAALPLVGAARYVSPSKDSAVVLDFGSTMIKRAWVAFENDQIKELHRLSGHLVEWMPSMSHDAATPEQVAKLIHGMASIIAQTWRDVQLTGLSPDATIPVCVAAYVKDGNPVTAQAGIYMQTNLVTDSLEDELRRRVSAELGRPLTIKLLHDATAAAATYAGEPYTAVITVGTALGIGFPGEATGLRAIGDGLTVS